MAYEKLSRSVNPKQVNMSDYLHFEDWNTSDEIGLIEWLCGWGKTYVAVSTTANGILSKVNECFGLDIQPHETLFLVSRTAIREQSLTNYSSNLKEIKSIDDLSGKGFVDEPHKIRIATYHKIGSDLEENKQVPSDIKLVICDEFHSLFTDTFASPLFAVKRWLSETQIIRIGLTATPQPLFYLSGDRHWTQTKCKEQFNFKFRNIASDTEPRYRFEHFNIVSASMSMETAFRKFRGNKDSKSIFFTYSARTASKLCRDNEDTLLFISEGNDKTDATGTLLRDYMDYENNSKLLRGKQIPQGFNNVIATSCFREGVDLKDDSVRTVVIQSFLPHEIIQSLGRFRNDIENVYILANRASFEVFRNECDTAFDFLNFFKSIKDDETAKEVLRMKYEEQLSNENGSQWYVNKYRGRYEIDYSVFAYWLYVYDCWYAVTNYDGRYSAFLDKPLDTRKEFYSNMFEAYTDDAIKYLSWDRLSTMMTLLEDKLSNIDTIVKPYLNKKLFADSDEREQLVEAISAIDKYGNSRKWTTVKKWLKVNGYKVEDGRERVNGIRKSYSVISR